MTTAHAHAKPYNYKLRGDVTPQDGEFVRFLTDDCGYFCVVVIGDGRWACLSRMMFTCAILVGTVGDICGHSDRWCYEGEGKAALALGEWCARGCEGEPQGWHRHPASGRRRPDGNAAREYTAH